jgi:predicted O-linked N-acetylglucosamine transferase (SPINDLY family)
LSPVPSAFSRAQQLHANGELEAALALYEECLRDAPDDWRALTRVGLLRVQQRRFDLALPLLQRAVALNPANAEAHAWLGEAWRNTQQLGAAIASLRHALGLQPQFAPAWFNLGLALAEMNEHAAAGDAWRRFLELRPRDARARCELAGAALRQGDPRGAASWLEQHLELFPADLGAANPAYQLAMAFDRAADLPSAIRWFERAALLAPGRAEIHNALAVAHHNFAQHPEALEHYRKALAIRPDFAEVHSNLLMALHYVEPEDCEAMFREHLAWAERHADGIVRASRASFANPRAGERRLRIGYVSPRLNGGPVAHNLLPLLCAHDHARFHVTCYATSSLQDAVTAEIRSQADAWREAWALDDAALVRLVREDAIDVLVDLSGHCPGHRLRVFAQRAAPVQVTWLDYSNTTGLAAMDYFVGDMLQTPRGTPQRFTEEVVRLPDVRLCYRPPENLPDVVAPPVLRNGYVTFGCINRLSKLNPALVAVWSEILAGAPRSRLLLKGTAYSSEEVRSAVQARFAVHGIGAERLELRGFSDEAQMMAEYGDIDVCLDPFPYNGSTTTCDALVMGVPVVSLAGKSLAARAGVMYLTSCGMPEWIAEDQAGYVRIACDAARDVAALSRLREGLRARFLASPVCDSPRFARAFEEILRSVWRRFVASGE